MKKGTGVVVVGMGGVSDGAARFIANARFDEHVAVVHPRPVLKPAVVDRVVTMDTFVGQPPGAFQAFIKAEQKRNRKRRAKILQRCLSMRGQNRG